MSLEANAMLCKISVHMWNNESIDNESAQELATTHKVETYTKVKRIHLPEYCLGDIRSSAGDIRLYHSLNTLPFLDRGLRLLPSSNYFEYMRGISAKKEKFNTQVDAFITQLPVYIADAKQKFGGKFDASYIPSGEEIRRRFYIELNVMPIAHANDWRIQLESKTIAKLKSDYEDSLQHIQKEATAHIWNELKTAIEHLIQKFETPKTRIHETLIPNVVETARLIKRLNTTHDKNIEDICNRLIQHLDGIDTHSVKVDPLMQEEVLVMAKSVLGGINVNIAEKG